LSALHLRDSSVRISSSSATQYCAADLFGVGECQLVCGRAAAVQFLSIAISCRDETESCAMYGTVSVVVVQVVAICDVSVPTSSE